MFDPTVLLGSIAGGVIAGIVGILTARYDRRQDRLEFHLERHKENLMAIENVINSEVEEVFPPIIGYDGTKLRIDLEVNNPDPFAESNKRRVDKVKDFKIVLKSMEMPVSNPNFSNIVETHLYEDIGKHFPDLMRKLFDFETMIGNKGSILLETFFVFEDLISKELKKEGFVDTGNGLSYGDIMKKHPLYAGQVIFDLSLEVPIEKWPMDYERYAVDVNKGIVDKISTELKQTEECKLLRTISKEIILARDDLLTDIGEILQGTRIRRKCSYV